MNKKQSKLYSKLFNAIREKIGMTTDGEYIENKLYTYDSGKGTYWIQDVGYLHDCVLWKDIPEFVLNLIKK